MTPTTVVSPPSPPMVVETDDLYLGLDMEEDVGGCGGSSSSSCDDDDDDVVGSMMEMGGGGVVGKSLSTVLMPLSDVEPSRSERSAMRRVMSNYPRESTVFASFIATLVLLPVVLAQSHTLNAPARPSRRPSPHRHLHPTLHTTHSSTPRHHHHLLPPLPPTSFSKNMTLSTTPCTWTTTQQQQPLLVAGAA